MAPEQVRVSCEKSDGKQRTNKAKANNPQQPFRFWSRPDIQGAKPGVEKKRHDQADPDGDERLFKKVITECRFKFGVPSLPPNKHE
ncbi:MAG: hypothetical protein HY804_03545 [Nitrospinae bacterium]|nr:hypothetical protein [Nitrospinota bacterium]